MRNNDVINAVLVVAAVLIVGLFGFTVRLEAAADRVTVLKAEGMTCGRCAATVTAALEKEPGVASVSVEHGTGKVTVGYDSAVVSPETLAKRVTASGYQSTVVQVKTMENSGAVAVKDAPAGPGCACCNKKVETR